MTSTTESSISAPAEVPGVLGAVTCDEGKKLLNRHGAANLSRIELILLTALRARARGRRYNPEATLSSFPVKATKASLARKCKYSDRQIRRAIASLTTRGLVEVLETEGEQNKYILHFEKMRSWDTNALVFGYDSRVDKRLRSAYRRDRRLLARVAKDQVSVVDLTSYAKDWQNQEWWKFRKDATAHSA